MKTYVKEYPRKVFRGNFLYASERAFLKMNQYAKDDIQGLLYMLIDMLHGGLPWS